MKVSMKLALSEVAAGALSGGLTATAWCRIDEPRRLVLVNVGPRIGEERLQASMLVAEARELVAELQTAIACVEAMR